MKLRNVILLGLLFQLNEGISQKGLVSIGAGPSLGVAAFNNNFTYYYKTGFGVNLQGDFAVTRLGSITTSLSYLSYPAKNLPVTKVIGTTFFKAGYQTYFNNSKIFTGADAGFAFYGDGFLDGQNRFVTGVKLGYSFQLGKQTFLDVFPAYNQVFNTLNNKSWFYLNSNLRFRLPKKSN